MLKKLLYGSLVGLAAGLLTLLLYTTGLFERLEYATWAMRVRCFLQPERASTQVKVILLDQGSLDWGKTENHWPWPWPREAYGALLDFCTRAGAKAVAFDVLFTEPSWYGVEDDEALGAAAERSRAFVAAVHAGQTAGDTEQWPPDAPTPWPGFDGLEAWVTSVAGPGVVAPRAAFPVPEIRSKARMLANVSDQPDVDGVLRRATLFRVFEGRAVPSLGLAAWLADRQAAGEDVAVHVEPGWLRLNAVRLPIDEAGRCLLRYRGPSGSHKVFSAASIIQSELRLQSGENPVVSPEELKDAYVFFGFSAPGLLDLRPTPVSKVYPGVEIHATMLDNLLERAALRDVPRRTAGISLLLLAWASGVLVSLSRKAWHSVAAFALCLPVPFALGFAGYAAGFWWPMVPSGSAVLLALVGAVVVNYATEGRQKAFIKSAFKFYLGETVIDQLLADPARLSLGGERRELTIFFSDIEKFSSFSERLDPGQLIGLLNEYLSEMGDIIKEEGGYLDKFIGDAIVAFWNAPVEQPDHAARACRAALRCQRRLAERRAEWRERYGADVRMRIGVNTGEVTVGNMGSRDRFNYTVLGDAANLASRLEGANKAFGTFLMVSETTWARTNGEVMGRELCRLTVVGRKQPVTVYEVLGLRDEPAPAGMENFTRGVGLFREGRFEEALASFEKAPDDAAARAYGERCRWYGTHPPPAWDGVWNLTEKG